jgi:hypothetical protein
MDIPPPKALQSRNGTPEKPHSAAALGGILASKKGKGMSFSQIRKAAAKVALGEMEKRFGPRPPRS